MGKTVDKTVHKTLGWLGVGTDTTPASIDVKDGKIVRIRPFKYYDKYTKEQANAWTLKARGKEYCSGEQSFLSPLSYGYKKRIYSENRVKYPMKRVDWDPNGERNPQNRGKSKYERISWDEACKIIADEIRRIQKEYGPTAIFIQGDGHGEEKNIGGGHGCSTRLMDLSYGPFGRLHPPRAPARQLGGLVLGCQARLGHGPRWQAVLAAEPDQGYFRSL